MAMVRAMAALSVLVVKVKIIAYLFIGLMLSLLSACATNQAELPAVTPAQLSNNPESAMKGTELTWGGEVVSVKNEQDRTLLEILAYPLNSSGEPASGYTSIGRFLADRQGYLEPREFKAGSRVTVTGPFLGFRDGKVDEAFYRYPALDAQGLTLWPEQAINQFREPRVHFGIGVGSHGRSGVGIGVGF